MHGLQVGDGHLLVIFPSRMEGDYGVCTRDDGTVEESVGRGSLEVLDLGPGRSTDDDTIGEAEVTEVRRVGRRGEGDGDMAGGRARRE